MRQTDVESLTHAHGSDENLCELGKNVPHEILFFVSIAFVDHHERRLFNIVLEWPGFAMSGRAMIDATSDVVSRRKCREIFGTRAEDVY